MYHTSREWLHAGGQLLALALPVAGALFCWRLSRQWRRATFPLALRASVARLRARPWRPAEAVLLLLALLLPMAPALLSIGRPLNRATATTPDAPQFVASLVFYALVLAGVLVAARRTGFGIGAALGITRETRWPAVRTGVVLGCAMLPPVILASWLAEGALRWLGVPLSRQAVFDTLGDPNLRATTQALLIFVAVVAAPIAEEAVFRGVVFPTVLGNRRLFGALLLVNVLFALLHLHPPSFLPLLTVGLCLSLGMLATGSLLTPMIMHAIFNGEMLLIFYMWPTLAS
jgi:membrane protease YdiL (CAAX protease family)